MGYRCLGWCYTCFWGFHENLEKPVVQTTRNTLLSGAINTNPMRTSQNPTFEKGYQIMKYTHEQLMQQEF
ncbi:hypothetical protein JCM12294_16470 [Desulfocicer niacini]